MLNPRLLQGTRDTISSGIAGNGCSVEITAATSRIFLFMFSPASLRRIGINTTPCAPRSALFTARQRGAAHGDVSCNQRTDKQQTLWPVRVAPQRPPCPTHQQTLLSLPSGERESIPQKGDTSRLTGENVCQEKQLKNLVTKDLCLTQHPSPARLQMLHDIRELRSCWTGC